MNGVFFSTRDNTVLNNLESHVKERWAAAKTKTEFDFTLALIVGDAGTGKTWLQDGLRYKTSLRPYYKGATNVAGGVLKKVFMGNQMYVNDTKVYSTTFQQFKMTPQKWARYMAYLYLGTPPEVHSATASTPEEFWGAISMNLKKVCRMIVEDYLAGGAKQPRSFITPQDYAEARHYVLKTCPQQPTPSDPREVHDMTMDRLCAIFPACKIPDQLMYNAEVIDEFARIEVSWLIVSVGLWYHFHNLYKTGLRMPVVVGVGSCTQSTVINSTCFKGCSTEDDMCGHDRISINDLSAITVLTKDCVVFLENLFVKENKHNRRTVGGCAINHAVLAILRNSLEMNEPIPKWAMEHLVSKMGVSEEEFYSCKSSIHLCVTHKECAELLTREKIAPEDKVMIRESMYAETDGVEVGPDKLYLCTAATGVMFKSANYLNDNEWKRSIVNSLGDLPTSVKFRFGITPSGGGKGGEEDEEEEKERHFSKWTAVREFNKGYPYAVTNTVNCIFTGVKGSLDDFLADLEEQDHIFCESVTCYREFVNALGHTIISYFPEWTEICRNIMEGKAALGGVDDLISSLNDLKSIMHTALKRKRVHPQQQKEPTTAAPSQDDVYDDYEIDFETGKVTPLEMQKKQLEETIDDSKSNNKKKKNKKPSTNTSSMMIAYDAPRSAYPSSSKPCTPLPKGETVTLIDFHNASGDNPCMRIRVGKTIEMMVFMLASKIQMTPDDYKKAPKGSSSYSYGKRRRGGGRPSSKKTKLDEQEDDAVPMFDAEELAAFNRVAANEIAANTAASEEQASEQDIVPREGRSTGYTVIHYFPFKKNRNSTVASSQGKTFNTTVMGRADGESIDANSFIVMITRVTSADNLKIMTKGGKPPNVKPLDTVTLQTTKKIHILSHRSGSGYL